MKTSAIVNPTVQFTEEYRNEHSATFAANCGKVSGVVSIGKFTVTVLCINAAHLAWKGGGRTFRTVAEALENYKSPEMRAIITAAGGKVAQAEDEAHALGKVQP